METVVFRAVPCLAAVGAIVFSGGVGEGEGADGAALPLQLCGDIHSWRGDGRSQGTAVELPGHLNSTR